MTRLWPSRGVSALALAALMAALLGRPALAGTTTAGPPVTPDRDLARRWAIEELAGREYAAGRPGLVERALSWLFDHLPQLPSGPASPLVLVAVVALLALAAGYALHRVGGWRGSAVRHNNAAGLFGPTALTAAEHRSAADGAAAQDRWSDAVLERFRAIARELEERAVLSPQPGRTADEVAGEAGRLLPGLSGSLADGSALFDDVCYGGRPGSLAADQRLRALDDQVRAAPIPAPTGPSVGPAR